MTNMEVEVGGITEEAAKHDKQDKHGKLLYAAFRLVAWLAECRRSHELVCQHWGDRDKRWRTSAGADADAY